MGNRVLGTDVGYGYVKDSQLNCFPSAYSTSDKSIIGSKPLIINGKTFFIGNGGDKRVCSVDKTSSELNMTSIIYDIILNGLTDVCLVLGLPMTQYSSQKTKLKESVMNYNQMEVCYNGKPYKFRVVDILVVYQGISSFYNLPDSELDGEMILVDFGSLSIDICHVEFSNGGSTIRNILTLYTGIRTIFTDIIDLVNNKFETKFSSEYADKILQNGLKIKGELVKLDFLKEVLQTYIDNIEYEIKLKFPHESCPIYLTGGIAPILYKPFSSRFNDVRLMRNSIYSNALGYSIIGNHKFKQRGLI